MTITYIIDDKLGGIASLICNLINNKIDDSSRQEIILLDKVESNHSKIPYHFNVDKEITLTVSSTENAYSLVRKLYKLLPDQPGVVVLNDGLEMQMLDHIPSKLTSYQIVHDEYNFSLALRYPNVVDVFVAHSKLYFEALKKELPERVGTIFYLPHGVTVSSYSRKHQDKINVIRLLFLGRMSETKGIFDLPKIAYELKKLNVPYEFTCIGNGPELDTLKKLWEHDTSVIFLSPNTTDDILRICAQHDVFVFPTQFEGTPVALLETMSVGLVPIATDLPGGITEIVTHDIGFRIPIGNVQLFSRAIKNLFDNPELLNRLSTACREKIKNDFNVKNTAAAYHELFSKYVELYSAKQIKRQKLGFRLDHPWIPNEIVKLARTLRRL